MLFFVQGQPHQPVKGRAATVLMYNQLLVNNEQVTRWACRWGQVMFATPPQIQRQNASFSH
ncbi:MAG: hypothetical protein AVDCRST_MAG56-3007 [uncultured Cytophagales bacterium]|uniref:Uncharacterized protein n=1 Tax=uncultured Cytophagales bacterium TaxID=158755 RepID=A0A6J4J753_9SPHI|nr:MAG: hypothetical protein AVDCRST_MAG56-3007 [uncultured Cytophagales bacterium]